MPKCRVLVRSFINNGLREEGDIVEYDGKIGSNLELLEAEEDDAPVEKTQSKKPWAKLKRGDSAEGSV
jgi:hypothetical protein